MICILESSLFDLGLWPLFVSPKRKPQFVRFFFFSLLSNVEAFLLTIDKVFLLQHLRNFTLKHTITFYIILQINAIFLSFQIHTLRNRPYAVHLGRPDMNSYFLHCFTWMFYIWLYMYNFKIHNTFTYLEISNKLLASVFWFFFLQRGHGSWSWVLLLTYSF